MFTKFVYLLLLLNFKWTFWNFNEKEWWNSNKHLISNELLNVYQTGPYFGNSKRKMYNDETIFFLYTNLRPSLHTAYIYVTHITFLLSDLDKKRCYYFRHFLEAWLITLTFQVTKSMKGKWHMCIHLDLATWII